MSFSESFDQSLDNVKWPASLQSLTPGHFQSRDNLTWPASLQSLVFHTCSAEKLNVVWPEDLQSLSFLDIEFPKVSDDSDSRVGKDGLRAPRWPRMAGWPRALRKLVFGDLAFMC